MRGKSKFFIINDIVKPEYIIKYPMPKEYGFKNIKDIERVKEILEYYDKHRKIGPDIIFYTFFLAIGFVGTIFELLVLDYNDITFVIATLLVIGVFVIIYKSMPFMKFSRKEYELMREKLNSYNMQLSTYELITDRHKEGGCLKNVEELLIERKIDDLIETKKFIMGPSFNDFWLIVLLFNYNDIFERWEKKYYDNIIKNLLLEMLIPNVFKFNRSCMGVILGDIFNSFEGMNLISKESKYYYIKDILVNYYEELSSRDIYILTRLIDEKYKDKIFGEEETKKFFVDYERKINTLKDEEISKLYKNSNKFIEVSDEFVREIGFNNWDDYLIFIKKKLTSENRGSELKLIFNKENKTRIRKANGIATWVYGLDTFYDLIEFYEKYNIFPDEIHNNSKNHLYRSYVDEPCFRIWANEIARINNYESWEKFEDEILKKDYNINFEDIYDSIEFVSKKLGYESFFDMYIMKSEVDLNQLKKSIKKSAIFEENFEDYDEDLENFYGYNDIIDENDEFFIENFEFSYTKVKKVLMKIGYETYSDFKNDIYEAKKIKKKNFENIEQEINYLVKSLGYYDFEDFYKTNMK